MNEIDFEKIGKIHEENREMKDLLRRLVPFMTTCVKVSYGRGADLLNDIDRFLKLKGRK